MEPCGAIEADDDQATRHPGEFAEETLACGVAVAMVPQADTQPTIKDTVAKG
jgi:hypothetical protein